jgi:pyruvate,water dikinase
MEVGGILSHGAILAREFNIPTVANVKNATGLFKDGQQITVNGTDGEIICDHSTSCLTHRT